jgi:hypothetical protein
MVDNAKKAYEQFPTIVNKLSNTNKTYTNTLEDYAAMDSHFADCKMGIGYSSNLAQLAMTYYWTDPKDEYYDNFVILSVLAQVIIDGCKREYMIDSQLEIQRIASLECMKMFKDVKMIDGSVVSIRNDFPEFMKYTRPIKYTTKHGKLRDFEDVKYDRKRLNDRINYSLKCPMNQLCKLLGKTKKMSYSQSEDIKDYFIKITDQSHADSRQMGKIRKLVDKYFWDVFEVLHSEESSELQYVETELLRLNAEIIEAIQKIKIGNKKTINRLIEACLGIDEKYSSAKIERNKIVILRVLYMMNPEKFLSNFIKNN